MRWVTISSRFPDDEQYGQTTACLKAAVEWVGSQLLAAKLGQAVDAFPGINGFDCNQDTELRGDLNHPCVSRQARSRLAKSGGTAAFHWIRILLPVADSNSMTHSAIMSHAWSL